MFLVVSLPQDLKKKFKNITSVCVKIFKITQFMGQKAVKKYKSLYDLNTNLKLSILSIIFN